MDIKNKTKTTTNIAPLNSPIERCLYGSMITIKDSTPAGSLPAQIYMSSYQCKYCSNPDCLICPSNYKGACKYCKKDSTICKDDTTTEECPLDYFSKNGICYRCPPGCSNCTSEKQCSACDTGLEIVSNLTFKLCKCAPGLYGISDLVADKLNCYSCDNSKCLTCDGSATQCTSCSAARSFFLYE